MSQHNQPVLMLQLLPYFWCSFNFDQNFLIFSKVKFQFLCCLCADKSLIDLIAAFKSQKAISLHVISDKNHVSV